VSEISLNEQVREALEQLWQAERVCLAKMRAYEALKAERQVWHDRVEQANDAWQLASQEFKQAGDRLHGLALQAEKEEAA
jgi:hypothetical protein